MHAKPLLDEAQAPLPARFAGKLCLDFANTIEPRGGVRTTSIPAGYASWPPHEYLNSYVDLVAWGVQVEALPERAALHLLAVAHRHQQAATATFARALTLREAIYRTFTAIAGGGEPARADITVLEHEHAAAAAHATLIRSGDAYVWMWRADADALDQMLWPVSASAIELLTSGSFERIKVCPGVPDDLVVCGWLFYDASKNQSRHWCSMVSSPRGTHACGSVAKARRQTQRRRSTRSGDA